MSRTCSWIGAVQRMCSPSAFFILIYQNKNFSASHQIEYHGKLSGTFELTKDETILHFAEGVLFLSSNDELSSSRREGRLRKRRIVTNLLRWKKVSKMYRNTISRQNLRYLLVIASLKRFSDYNAINQSGCSRSREEEAKPKEYVASCFVQYWLEVSTHLREGLIIERYVTGIGSFTTSPILISARC